MSQKIQLRRGLEVNLPALSDGEPAFTTDTLKMFVGSSTKGNVELAKNSTMYNISYVIDLDKWGIKKGSFGKPPYTTDQWTIAYNNLLGFNNALTYAKDNGYNRIVVPKGNYSFCYTNFSGATTSTTMITTSIKLFSNQTLDLNGSTFEVMYDSINKNPYDLSPSGTPAWKLSGKLIDMDECFNSHITNGTILGEIPNRSFTDGGTGFESEKGMEQTKAIGINNGAKFCSISYLDVSMFMGDGIRIGNSPTQTTNWNVSGYGNNICSPGYVNSDGTITSMSGAYVSPKYTLIQGEHKVIQMRTNGGYTRIPTIKGNFFEFVFLDTNNAVVSRKKAVYLQTVTVPYNATGLRIQFTNEDVGLSSLTIDYAITKPQASNIHIHHCEIHDNHRGGISGGADYTLIEWNRIYHNGLDSGIGVPLFPDTTRYCINFEDSYCNDLKIRNNLMFSGFNGLLLGAYHIQVTNNYMSEFSSGVLVYNNAKTLIQSNYFYNAGSVGLMDSVSTQRRNIVFRDNWVHGSGMNVQPTGKTHVEISDNDLYLETLTIVGDVALSGNRLESITGSKTTAFNFWAVRPTKCTDNTFSNCIVSVDPYDGSSIASRNTYNSATFRTSKWTNNIEVLNSFFANTDIHQAETFDKTTNVSISFTDCIFQNTTLSMGESFTNNTTNGNITIFTKLKRCKVKMTSALTTTTFLAMSDNVASGSYTGGVQPRVYEGIFTDCDLDNFAGATRYISNNDATTSTRKLTIERCSLDTNTFKLFSDRTNNSAILRNLTYLNNSTPLTMTSATISTYKSLEAQWNGTSWV